MVLRASLTLTLTSLLRLPCYSCWKRKPSPGRRGKRESCCGCERPRQGREVVVWEEEEHRQQRLQNEQATTMTTPLTFLL